MTLELEPVITGDNMPPWIQQLYQFQAVKNAGAVGKLVTKTQEEGKRLIDKIKEKVGRKIETTSVESHSVAVKAYQDYQAALVAAAQSAGSRGQLFQLPRRPSVRTPHRQVLILKRFRRRVAAENLSFKPVGGDGVIVKLVAGLWTSCGDLPAWKRCQLQRYGRKKCFRNRRAPRRCRRPRSSGA
jgi:hypothetical protein